jgi:hypothetical protein
MTKHHYVYHSYEEWGRSYIGCRTCDCLPEEDIKYFGSFRDKTFKPTEKTILFVCKTRKEAAEIEIILHDFFDVAVNPQFANRSKQTSTKFDTTGVPKPEESKKKQSETNSGRFLGASHPRSKAIITIEPDGTERHYGSGREVARKLEISQCRLCYYLKSGKSPRWGKFKSWRFIYKNPEDF